MKIVTLFLCDSSKLRHTCFALIFLAFAFSSVVVCAQQVTLNASQEKGLDLFIGACRHSGDNSNLIYSGYIDLLEKEIGASLSAPTYSQEELDRLLVVCDGDVKKRDEVVRQSIERHKESIQKGRSVNVLFRRDGTSEKFYRLIISQRDASEQYRFVFRGLQSHQNTELKDSVFWGYEQNVLTIESQMPFAEYEVFLWGRVQGKYAKLATIALIKASDFGKYIFPISSVEQFKKIVRLNPNACIFVKDENYDNDAIASIVDVNVEGRLIQRYWIDASRGYICPLVQIYDEKTGRLVEEHQSKNYFLEQKTGIWFPEHYTYRVCDPESGSEILRKEYSINRNTFVLNKEFSDNEFTLDIPEGLFIDDHRGASTARYRANQKGSLSLCSEGIDLKKMEWLDGFDIFDDVDVKKPSAFFLFFRITTIVIGIFFDMLGILITPNFSS